jgi:hypothetical protein
MHLAIQMTRLCRDLRGVIARLVWQERGSVLLKGRQRTTGLVQVPVNTRHGEWFRNRH